MRTNRKSTICNLDFTVYELLTNYGKKKEPKIQTNCLDFLVSNRFGDEVRDVMYYYTCDT
jgi:hypothetical protein